MAVETGSTLNGEDIVSAAWKHVDAGSAAGKRVASFVEETKGRIQAEELRGQMGERLVGAYQATARAMGMTTEELAKATEQGRITAEKVFPVLRQELMEMAMAEGALEDAINDTTSAANRFSNAVFIMNTRMNEAGFDRALNDLLSTMAEAVKESGFFWDLLGTISGVFVNLIRGPVEFFGTLGEKLTGAADYLDQFGFKLEYAAAALPLLIRRVRLLFLPLAAVAYAMSAVSRAWEEGGVGNWAKALAGAAVAFYFLRKPIMSVIRALTRGASVARSFWDAVRGGARTTTGGTSGKVPESIRKPDGPGTETPKKKKGFFGSWGSEIRLGAALQAAQQTYKEAVAVAGIKGLHEQGYDPDSFAARIMDKTYPAMGRTGALTVQEQAEALQMIVNGDIRFEIEGQDGPQIADEVIRVINEKLIRPASGNDPILEK